MRFLRSLLLLIFLVVYTIPYAIACFIAMMNRSRALAPMSSRSSVVVVGSTMSA